MRDTAKLRRVWLVGCATYGVLSFAVALPVAIATGAGPTIYCVQMTTLALWTGWYVSAARRATVPAERRKG